MLVIDPKTKDRIVEVNCACGAKGAELRFPEKHGRTSDTALEQEMLAIYSHVCDDCCCKDAICDKHAKREPHDPFPIILKDGKRTSTHPNKKYHHNA